MARKTQISKDVILQSALEMLIEKGYKEINIKTLSQKIGCSTQPIVWHFGNMDGMRKELAEYALNYANERMRSTANGIKAFTNVGAAYIEIAFEEPHLFRYLYMSGDSGCLAESFEDLTATDENAAMAEQIAAQLKLPIAKVDIYYRNMMIYTHGLASLIASGLIRASKEEVRQMIKNLSDELLSQASLNSNNKTAVD